MLVQYNQAFPDCAERIVAMAESQLAHRQQLETSHLSNAQRAEHRGQIFGFLIAITAILGGVYLIDTGKSTAGLVSILSTLTALTGIFVYGRWAQARERRRKREEVRDNQLPLPYEQEDRSDK